jgi:hypothetical protein
MSTTEPKAFKDGLQFAWDSTSIKLAEECLRKYQYKMLDGWQPLTLSVHLRFGAVYATALEHYHKWVALGTHHDEALEQAVHEALVSTWDYDKDPEGNIIPGSGTPWVSEHNLKTRENCIRTIVWYLEHFREDPAMPVKLADGTPAVELSFALPVDDGIVFTGHLDRLAEYAGNPMVVDQKTTGTTITARYFDGYKPDIQMSMYTFAGQAVYNVPVKGVIIDAAQIAVGFSRFERGITMRTQSELEEFYDTTMETITRARSATALNNLPMNRTSCDKFGGCEFRRVCSKSPEVREQFLKADFAKGKRWDPLEAR